MASQAGGCVVASGMPSSALMALTAMALSVPTFLLPVNTAV